MAEITFKQLLDPGRDELIDIEDLNLGDVLQALQNEAGHNFDPADINSFPPVDLSAEDAARIAAELENRDYVATPYGKNVHISVDQELGLIEASRYDLLNGGEGTARAIVELVRQGILPLK